MEEVEEMNDIQEILDEYKDEFDTEDFDEYMDYLKDEDDIEPEEEQETDNLDTLKAQEKKIKEKEIRDRIEEDKVKKYQEVLYPETKVYRSILKEYFPVDLCIKIDKVSRTYAGGDNNKKRLRICELMDEYHVPYSYLGPGTNRFGIMIDEYCVKIAFDKDGKIDNKREFMYSLQLQPYVVKTYEVSESGLFSVCEYVQSFEISDYSRSENTKEMRRILKDIASEFIIGDVGITSKNYANWGYRDDGSLVILDYAYIYSVSFRQFVCSCDGISILYYDNDFNNMICPNCGKKYSFSQLRKKISKEDQNKEIGDIMQRGYIIHESEEELPFNHKYVIGATDEIMKRILKEQKKESRKIKIQKDKPQDWDSEEVKSFDEILKSI